MLNPVSPVASLLVLVMATELKLSSSTSVASKNVLTCPTLLLKKKLVPGSNNVGNSVLTVNKDSSSVLIASIPVKSNSVP